MAHNLATINGRVAMAYQGETPWHKLGTRIDSGDDLGAVMTAANLDWTVGAQPIYLQDGRLIPSRQAIVRQGDDSPVLGVVSSLYQPIQNADAFAPFAPAMKEFGLTVEAAGALGNGEKVWMLFRLPTSIAVNGADVVNGYGLAMTSHDGSTALEFRPTPIRVVCQNTLNIAVGRGGEQGRIFSVNHIGEAARDLDRMAKVVQNVIAAMNQAGETFASMAAKKMTPAEVVAFVERVFPTPATGAQTQQLADKRATVADLVWSGVGAELAGSDGTGTTAWACYNAVTEYFDHVATAKNSAATNRSALFGSGADAKVAAFVAARELVAA